MRRKKRSQENRPSQSNNPSGKRMKQSEGWHQAGKEALRRESTERISLFFREQTEYLPALLLFRNKTRVPRGDIAQVSRGAVTVLIGLGIIADQKGGKMFELTPAAKEVLEKMPQ
jgi:hypothetical protein